MDGNAISLDEKVISFEDVISNFISLDEKVKSLDGNVISFKDVISNFISLVDSVITFVDKFYPVEDH